MARAIDRARAVLGGHLVGERDRGTVRQLPTTAAVLLGCHDPDHRRRGLVNDTHPRLRRSRPREVGHDIHRTSRKLALLSDQVRQGPGGCAARCEAQLPSRIGRQVQGVITGRIRDRLLGVEAHGRARHRCSRRIRHHARQRHESVGADARRRQERAEKGDDAEGDRDPSRHSAAAHGSTASRRGTVDLLAEAGANAAAHGTLLRGRAASRVLALGGPSNPGTPGAASRFRGVCALPPGIDSSRIRPSRSRPVDCPSW